MADWEFCQSSPEERLAKLQHFSMEKQGVEFVITVKEFVSPPDQTMKFYAEANREVNQGTAPFRPVGWGGTLLEALRACMQGIRKFPYEA
jgi:hypothetical protein